MKFYGFSEDPFDLKPDSKFFFPSEGHSEALASLLYGIDNKKGFVVVLGETGIGKTTLIQHAIEILGARVKTIFIPHSRLPFHEILQEMLVSLKLPLGPKTKGSMIHELYHHLIHCVERNETVAIIMDEAENIGLDVIEEVRLLSNLETTTSKLLQIVLVGELGLREKLRSEEIRQIKQRVVINCQINPLTKDESLHYIDHRLKIAGSDSSRVFTDKALSLICRRARGIPLALNVLCHNALSVGCHRSEKMISPATVRMIQSRKEIVTADGAQTLASRHRRQQQLSWIVSALVLIAFAAYYGRGYVQSNLSVLENTVIIHEVRGAIPGVHHTDPATVVTVPAPEEKPAATETPKNPESSPAPSSRSGTDAAAALTVPAPEKKPAATETPKNPASSPAPSSRSGSEIRIKETVEAKQGTNLYAIAYQHYKVADETFIDHILKLNPEITNPDLILVDQKIKLPEITDSLLIVATPEPLFKVHLRTFPNKQRAERYGRDATFAGIERQSVPLQVSPQYTWYRVMVGSFSTRDEALNFIEEIKQKGFTVTPR